MTRTLNLSDIQGHVTRAYGRYSFPFARYIFFHFNDPQGGRDFIDRVRKRVTTAAVWDTDNKKPFCTVNLALNFPGMLAIQLPVRTLKGMPPEFIEGMKQRAYILGDRDQTQTEDTAEDEDWDKHWDKIWQDSRATGPSRDPSKDVHVIVTLNARSERIEPEDLATPLDKPHAALEETTNWVLEQAKETNVTLLTGIGADGKQKYQEASVVFDKIDEIVVPTAKEHFGFTDGIGNPVFEGQLPEEDMEEAAVGRGKIMGYEDDGTPKWEPLKTGEFILGHPDESQEIPPTASPPEFMHNGTYFAFRKLHENVGTFEEVISDEADRYAKVMGVGKEEAVETIHAKMCGRWKDGVPLSKVPTYDEWVAFGEKKGFRKNGKITLVGVKNNFDYIKSKEARDFRYGDDMQGFKCPGGAHMRRMNTRDYLDPLNSGGISEKTGKPDENPKATSALNKRRRILRRGLPYGPPNFEHKDDDTEQGVIMIVMGANLFRQFEFVQQQWIQYGLDFHQGNNTCPMLGDHSKHKRFTIPSDPKSGKPPYVMSKLKTFVECRGGDYFFVPSMTALRMMAMGIVDPT